MKNIFRTEERTEGFYRPGVRMEEDGIRFTIAVPGRKKVSLLLYDKSNGELAAELPLSQNNGTGSIRTVKVLGLDWKEYRYQYKIEDCLTPDFYARGIWKGNDEQSRQCEMDFSSFSWGKSKKPQISYHQGIMYHLHVRNYTMHEKSGVIHKGTFLGLQEKIPYLKKLGINQLILMPVYEFDEQQQKEVLAVSKNEHFTKKIKQQKN